MVRLMKAMGTTYQMMEKNGIGWCSTSWYKTEMQNQFGHFFLSVTLELRSHCIVEINWVEKSSTCLLDKHPILRIYMGESALWSFHCRTLKHQSQACILLLRSWCLIGEVGDINWPAFMLWFEMYLHTWGLEGDREDIARKKKYVNMWFSRYLKWVNLDLKMMTFYLSVYVLHINNTKGNKILKERQVRQNKSYTP